MSIYEILDMYWFFKTTEVIHKIFIGAFGEVMSPCWVLDIDCILLILYKDQ